MNDCADISNFLVAGNCHFVKHGHFWFLLWLVFFNFLMNDIARIDDIVVVCYRLLETAVTIYSSRMFSRSNNLLCIGPHSHICAHPFFPLARNLPLIIIEISMTLLLSRYSLLMKTCLQISIGLSLFHI